MKPGRSTHAPERYRPAKRRAKGNGAHLEVCTVRAFSGPQYALAARSFSHRSGPSSAADRRPISAASLTLFFRGTLAPICETSDAFAAVSAQVFASENRDLASQLASYNFLTQPPENTKAAEVAAGESFRLAGPTGLEPATSGVTGRRANPDRSLAGLCSARFCSHRRSSFRSTASTTSPEVSRAPVTKRTSAMAS